MAKFKQPCPHANPHHLQNVSKTPRVLDISHHVHSTLTRYCRRNQQETLSITARGPTESIAPPWRGLKTILAILMLRALQESGWGSVDGSGLANSCVCFDEAVVPKDTDLASTTTIITTRFDYQQHRNRETERPPETHTTQTQR